HHTGLRADDDGRPTGADFDVLRIGRQVDATDDLPARKRDGDEFVLRLGCRERDWASLGRDCDRMIRRKADQRRGEDGQQWDEHVSDTRRRRVAVREGGRPEFSLRTRYGGAPAELLPPGSIQAMTKPLISALAFASLVAGCG